MSPLPVALGPMLEQYQLHTSLFTNCLKDMPEVDALMRLNEKVNNAAFLAAHLVDVRGMLGQFIGLQRPTLFNGALEGAKGIDDIARMPSLTQIASAWGEISPLVEGGLVRLTEEVLAGPAPHKFPAVSPTLLGTITFLMHHEAYHIGQLATIRKYVGLKAMSYRPVT